MLLPNTPTSEPSVAEEIVEQPTPEQADVPEVTDSSSTI